MKKYGPLLTALVLVCLASYSRTAFAQSPPTISIKRLTPFTERTNGTSVTFQLNFSENVLVTSSDFILSGAGSPGATITLIPDDGIFRSVFQVVVASISMEGLLDLDVDPGNNIENSMGVGLSTVIPLEETYTIDLTGPMVMSSVSDLTHIGFTLNLEQTEVGSIHYVVLEDDGAPPNAEQVADKKDGNGTSVTVGNSLPIATANMNVPRIIPTLFPGTIYEVYVVGEDDLGNLGPVIHLPNVATDPPDTDSGVALASPDGATSGIVYSNHQQTDLTSVTGVSLMNIDVTDQGTTDGVPTTLSTLQLSITNHSLLRKLAVYDGTTELAELTVDPANMGTETFTGMNFSIPDGATGTLNIRGSFSATVTDNQQVTLTVAAATGDASGSRFTTGTVGGISSTLSGFNTVTVNAQSIAFMQQPTITTVGIPMDPPVTIQAVDALGNRDADYNGMATVTSDGTLSSPVMVMVTSGFATVGSIVHTTAMTGRRLTVMAPGLTDAESDMFTIRSLNTDSNVGVNSTIPGTDNIDYAANQQTDLTSSTGVRIMGIEVTDSGTDGLPTILTDLAVSITNYSFVRRLALYDGATELAELTVDLANMGTETFTGMNFSVADGTIGSLTVRASFLTNVTDNDQISIQITAATADPSGSTFTTGTVDGTSPTGGDINRIEVTATQLRFSAAVTSVLVSADFSATVQAIDIYGNRDLDETSSVTIGKASGPMSGTLGGTPLTQALVNGEQTFGTLNFDVAGAYTLSVTDNDAPLMTSGTSSTVRVVLPDADTALSDGPFDEATPLSSLTGSAPGQTVFDFTVEDMGSDGVGTLITEVTISQGNTGMPSALGDWAVYIAGARLSDGSVFIDATTIDANSIVFSSVPVEIGQLGEVGNGATKTFVLSIWFGSNLPADFDGSAIQFSLEINDFVTAPVSSAFDPAGSTLSPSSAMIEVVATRLAFTELPTAIYVGADFSLSVAAQDANGNLDTDESSGVAIDKDSGPGTLTNGGLSPANLVMGAYTWDALQVDSPTPPSYVFMAVAPLPSSLAGATSSGIATSIPDDTSVLSGNGEEQTSRIPYVNYQGSDAALSTSNSIKVFSFSVEDNGGDGLPTTIGEITLNTATNGVRAVGIYDPVGTAFLGTALMISTTTRVPLFPPISVPDGETSTYDLYVSFDNGAMTDHSQFIFTIRGVGQNPEATSTINRPMNINVTSSMAPGTNEIDVVATQLVMTSIDGFVVVDAPFNAILEAQDVNSNVDLDFSEAVTASVASGAGTIATSGGDDSETPSMGVYMFGSLRLDGGGPHTISFRSAISGLTILSTSVTAAYNTTDIIVDPTFTFPEFFNYTRYDESTITFAGASSLEVAHYLVREGGVGDNSDGLNTQIMSIRLSLNSDAQANITSLALFTGGGIQLGTQQVSGAMVTFAFSDNITDTNDQRYILKATFDQTSAVSDGAQMIFTVSGIMASGGRMSGLLTTTPNVVTPSVSNENILDVVADRIVYVTDPGNTQYERVSGDISVNIEARDTNGSLDTDETSTLQITGSSVLGGTATILGGSATLSAGRAFETIQITNEHEDLTLTVADRDGTAGSRGTLTTIANAGEATMIDIHDTVAPTVTDRTPTDNESSASLTTSTLTISFSEEIAINPSGSPIVIQGNTTPIAEQIELDISDALQVSIGTNQRDVTLHLPQFLTSGITYYVIIYGDTFWDSPGNSSNIGELPIYFAGYPADSDWNWTMETVLTIQAATTTMNPNEVKLQFNDNVQINGAMSTVLSYFELTDLGGVGTSQTLSSLADGTTGDNELEINLADLSSAGGDIAVTYAVPTMPGAPDISEDGDTSVKLNEIMAASAVIVDIDGTNPTLTGATETSTTELHVNFNENVQITSEIAADFVVVDGQGIPFPVSDWQDNTTQDQQLELIIADLDGGIGSPPSPRAIGDLTVTYNKSSSSIQDFGFNELQSGIFSSVDRDVTAPVYTSARRQDGNQILVVFDEDVRTSGTNPSDFTVTDGANNNYSVFVQSDGAINDPNILLLVSDLNNALGDLTVEYDNRNNEISDFGGNDAASGSQMIDLDVMPPNLISAVRDNNTEITVTFSEPVFPPSSPGMTGFTVADAVGTNFRVAAQSDGTFLQDDKILLTVADLSSAVGDLFVSYTDMSNPIMDFGMNIASDVSDIIIDLDFILTPGLTENALPLTNNLIYERNDTEGDNLALFRTNGMADPQMWMPLQIFPSIEGSTITIHRDEALRAVVYVATNVSRVSGVQPTVADFMAGSVIDFSGSDDNGTFTFYISETAVDGVSSRGPAATYSIAFLDDVTNTTESTSFGEDDVTGTTLNVQHPPRQLLRFGGNGLSGFIPNVRGTSLSTVNFFPVAAVLGINQITISWTNPTSLVEAIFLPTELLFNVNASFDVFTPDQKTAFGKTEDKSLLDINTSLSNIDIGGSPDLPANSDFFNIEAYYILNGSVATTVGDPGILNPDGGNIADEVLMYNGPDSDGGVDPSILIRGGSPTYIAGEWEFDPSGLSGLGLSRREVDTIRIVTLSQADLGGSESVISQVDVFLYPDPEVRIVNVNLLYCEDEADFRIQAEIKTYSGMGGVDSTGVIGNGYLLLYDDNADFSSPEIINFTSSAIEVLLMGMIMPEMIAPRGATNIFNPSDPDQDGIETEDETGFYRIEYTSEPQTAAGTTNTATVDFEVRAVPSMPVLDVVSTDLNLAGGLRGSEYIFEYCEGMTIPDIPVNVTTTGADDVDGNPNRAYNWYNFENGSVVASNTATLSPTLLFGTATPSGNFTRKLHVTRTVDGCESNPVKITIRVFSIPEKPTISLTDNVVNNESQNIFEDIGNYFFEYCTNGAITYDQLVITSVLRDIPENRNFIQNRSYFRIYGDEAGTSRLFDLTFTGGPYTIDLSGVPSLGISSAPSATANGVVTKDFWISKVVADSSAVVSGANFVGCESELTKVTASIYTYPEIPAISAFTGDPHEVSGVVNYYMCRNELFPDVGINPPNDASNTNFEWYTDSGLTDRIVTASRRGEVVSQADLTGHTTDPDNFNPGTMTEKTYSYFVRLISNINENSGSTGCEGPVREVNITVFPDASEPMLAVVDVDSQLEGTQNDVGNFDRVYNFCVQTGSGLHAATQFNNSITYSGANQNEIQWFAANATGDALVSSIPVATGVSTESGSSQSVSISAADLRMQGAENQTFYFGVLHNTDVIGGYNNFFGCFSDITFVQVVVSTIPAASFSFNGITVNKETCFNFFDDNSSSIATDGVVFKVFDESSNLVTSHTASNLTSYCFPFRNSGVYRGELSITSQAGCENILTRTFIILKKITIQKNVRYTESFESDDGGWFPEFQSDDGLTGSVDASVRVSSWEYGIPDGEFLNGNAQGALGKAWATTATHRVGTEMRTNTYLGGEVSYVYSPAFDISVMRNPAIGFTIFRNLDGIKDGIVFQYSLNDGQTWVTLGNYDPNVLDPDSRSSGQNWFDTNGISGSPGESGVGGSGNFNRNRVGWADTPLDTERNDKIYNKWHTATHPLGMIVGASNVRFRFALGAAGADTDIKLGNGFGFDEMLIFELNRTVLVEQFSSSVSLNSKTVEGEFLMDINPDRVMWINYFTDLENGVDGEGEKVRDSINVRNTIDPEARAGYYGIGEAPTSVLDGEVVTQRVANEKSWSANDISIKQLEPPKFEMTSGLAGVLKNTSDPGVVSVSATFRALYSEETLVDLSFVFAVIEKKIAGFEYGGIGVYTSEKDTLRNVLKILLPGPAGFNIHRKVAVNEEFNYSVDWIIDDVYDPEQLRVIAFVQDNSIKNNKKEILQSGYVDIGGASESITGIEDLTNFSVYPNPAHDEFSVDFKDNISVKTRWALYDQAGREILKGSVEKGTRSLKVKTDKISSGLYLFHLYLEDERRKVVRVLISN